MATPWTLGYVLEPGSEGSEGSENASIIYPDGVGAAISFLWVGRTVVRPDF